MNEFDEYEWEFSAPLHPAADRFVKFREVYERETLRGRMLVTMGFVEDILARSIQSYLVDTDPKLVQSFASRSLGSLSAKANLSYLLGIIDEQEFKQIEKMAKIRNLFAHEPLADKNDALLRNHVRDLSVLLGLGHYKESESKDFVGETWSMTIWALLTRLVNRPENAEQRRLKPQSWDFGAP